MRTNVEWIFKCSETAAVGDKAPAAVLAADAIRAYRKCPARQSRRCVSVAGRPRGWLPVYARARNAFGGKQFGVVLRRWMPAGRSFSLRSGTHRFEYRRYPIVLLLYTERVYRLLGPRLALLIMLN